MLKFQKNGITNNKTGVGMLKFILKSKIYPILVDNIFLDLNNVYIIGNN